MLRDSASETGTILAQWELAVTTTTYSGMSIDLCDLNIVGSGNTAMTLEFNPVNWPPVSKLSGSVDLVYDAQ